MSLSTVVVVPAVPPAVGGVETYAELFATTMADAGVAVHLVCGNEPRPAVREALIRRGGSVTVLPEIGEWLLAETLHELVRERKADLVHAFSHDTIVHAAVALAHIDGGRRVPLVVTPGEMSTDENDFGLARSRFAYRLGIAGLFHESRFYETNALFYGCEPQRSAVCSAVAVDDFARGNRQRGREFFGLPEDGIVISCPSRYTPRKGQLELIQAVSLLPAAMAERVTLVLAGSLHSGWSDYLEQLREEAGRCPARVLFVEAGRDEMPDLMAASDIVAQPSWREGLGLSALEAMAAGTPVLLTNVTGFDEFAVHGENSYVVPARDPGALVRGILDLLGDPALRRRLVENGRAYVEEHYRPQLLAAKALAFYAELTDAADSDAALQP